MAVSQGAIRAGRAFVEIYADNSRLVRGMRLAEQRLKMFGAKVQQLGQQFLRFGSVMAAPFVLSTKVFVGFDDQMRTLQAVIGATAAEFEMLTEKAKELGRTTSFTAAQVAAGMVELGRQGFNPREIESSIGSVLALSRATATDLAETSLIASGTLRAFALNATAMGRVADVLTATANNSAQTLMDLGEAMKYTAPIAAEYNLTLEDTAKVLGALANFQIKGSLAGTTMKNILLRLVDPKIQAELAKLGIKATNSEGALRKVAEVLTDIGQATEQMPNAKRLAIFNELFGMRAVAGGAKLTKGAFAQLNNAIDNAAGKAEKTAQIMDSGLGGALRMLWSAIEGIAIEIGESVAPMFGLWAQKLQTLSGIISKWVSQHRGFVMMLATITVGAIAAGAALMGIGTALKLMALPLSVAFGLFSLLTGTLTVIKGLLLALLTPLGTVAAALGVLTTAWFTMSKYGAETLTWLGGRFKDLGSEARSALEAISDALAAGDLKAAAELAAAGIKVAFTSAFVSIEEAWASSVAAIKLLYEELINMTAKKSAGFWDKARTFTTTILKGTWEKAVGSSAQLMTFLGGNDVNNPEMRQQIADDSWRKYLKIDDAWQDLNKALKPLQDTLQEESDKNKDAIARRLNDRLAIINEELATAQKNYEEAKERAQQSGGEKKPEDAPAPPTLPPLPALEDFVNNMNFAIDKLSAVGTFNAQAAGQLGRGRTEERIAKATEATAKEITQLRRQIDKTAWEGGRKFF